VFTIVYMKSSSPFELYQLNKYEFIHKVCAICWDAMFFPEHGETMIKCVRLDCMHTFHKHCIQELLIKSATNRCPECRRAIDKIIDINSSLELAIRNDAFEHGEVDDNLREQFANSRLVIANYPYHKTVFKRWRLIKFQDPRVANTPTDCLAGGGE
jgi:hypothetical protein